MGVSAVPAAPFDPRVTMVLQVLGGASHAEVAARWGVDTEVLRRWVRGFVAGGAAVVTNQPQPRAAQERDRFLTAFAHELRTPLTAVRGWVELLGQGDASPALRSQGLTALRSSVERLVERLAEVELLAAASLGRLSLCPERVSLQDLGSPRPADAELRIGAGATHVVVDAPMFRMVLRDLWRSAQLSPVPRTLRLETLLDGPWIEIRVVREAAPMDPVLLEALFEPFGDENHNSDGTGVTMGLYLARALLVAHGGSIGVEQDASGLTFWVRVPHRAADHHPGPPTETTQARTLLATTPGD